MGIWAVFGIIASYRPATRKPTEPDMNSTDSPTPTQPVVTVIGGGSWATALTKILTERTGNPISVRWWLRNRQDVDHIRQYGKNPSYLSSVSLDSAQVLATDNLAEALEGSQYVLLVVPAAFIGGVLSTLPKDAFDGKIVISAIKGMIPDEDQLVTEFVAEHFTLPESQLCAIVGPCHAEEVAMEKQSYLTVGGTDHQTCEAVATLIRGRYIHVTEIADLYGVEYCAVMKNVIAIACGIARGAGYGDNFQAVLVCNAMQEIKEFLEAISPNNGHRDLNASAYLGDLLVTAYSQFSRNRTFGHMVGRGYSVNSAQLEMNMIAEGYYAVQSIWRLNQELAVEMPVTATVYNILYERIAPLIELRLLQDKLT